MASDIQTALLADAATTAATKTVKESQQKAAKYESKHAHIDTEEEKAKTDEVLKGIDDHGLRLSILFLDKLSKVIIVVFTFLGFGCAAAAVLGVFGLFLPRLIWMVILFGAINFGAILGAYGVYKYGALQEYLDNFERENKKYESALINLRDMRVKLKDDVHSITTSVNGLRQNTDDLNETMKEYDDIRNQLSELCGEDGDMKDLHKMVDSMNNGYESMKAIILQNKKASLLATYYGVSTSDGEDGLSESEWKKFLAKLTRDQRKLFEKEGTFHDIAGDDGVIDLREFQNLVDQVIADCDEEMLRLMNQS